MEITGNKFAREAFGELGIQKTSGIYDYESSSLQKYKTELAEKVMEFIDMEDLKDGKVSNFASTSVPFNSNGTNNRN
jgi:hypothetical protein